MVVRRMGDQWDRKRNLPHGSVTNVLQSHSHRYRYSVVRKKYSVRFGRLRRITQCVVTNLSLNSIYAIWWSQIRVMTWFTMNVIFELKWILNFKITCRPGDNWLCGTVDAITVFIKCTDTLRPTEQTNYAKNMIAISPLALAGWLLHGNSFVYLLFDGWHVMCT